MNQYLYPKRISDKIAEMYLPQLVYRPINDNTPNFTKLVQKLYANLAVGQPDLWEEKSFTPESWKSIKANFDSSDNADFYKQLGAPQSILLVERITDERGLLTRYLRHLWQQCAFNQVCAKLCGCYYGMGGL